MPARYKISYFTPAGLLAADNLVFSSLSYFRKENEVGQVSLLLPNVGGGLADFQRDGRLEVYRAVNDGPFYLEGETSFLVERIRMTTDEKGQESMELTANDMLVVMRRRVVAYDAGANSGYTAKLGFADDLMKSVVRQNYNTAALDASRNIETYLTIPADRSMGALIAAEISWRNVFDVLKEFADASTAAGLPLFFDVVKASDNLYQFTTYRDYRGQDHSAGSGSPVLLSSEAGNLSAPEVFIDWMEESNYVYAGGAGEDNFRPVAEVYDAQRRDVSPFSRVENFYNEGNATDPAVLLTVAQKVLQHNRPRLVFSGQVLDTPALLYGLHYGFGDLVTASYQGMAFDCRVSAVKIEVDSSGEKRDIRLESTYNA